MSHQAGGQDRKNTDDAASPQHFAEIDRNFLIIGVCQRNRQRAADIQVCGEPACICTPGTGKHSEGPGMGARGDIVLTQPRILG